MTEIPHRLQEQMKFFDAQELLSPDDLIMDRIKSLDSNQLAEGAGRQFHLTENGKQEARNIFHDLVNTSGSYYEQREVIQRLRERRGELSRDHARILDRMTSSFQLQTEYVRSIQIAEELKTSSTWTFYVDTLHDHSHESKDQIWRKVARNVAKQRSAVVEEVARYKEHPHKEHIETLVALRETESIQNQYDSLRSVLQKNPFMMIDTDYQTASIYGDLNRFSDSVTNLELGLKVDQLYALMEKASVQDRQRMELISLPEEPPVVETLPRPQQVAEVQTFVREEVAPQEKPAVVLEKIQRKFKLPRRIAANIVAAAIGVIASWSPVLSPLVSSAEQSPVSPPSITLNTNTYKDFSAQLDLRFEYTNPFIPQSETRSSPVPVAESNTPKVSQTELASFGSTIQSVEGRGVLIAGEPGRYVGDYSPSTGEQRETEAMYALAHAFTEKQKQFDGHIALQLDPGTRYSIAIANTDTDKSGAITNRFEVSPSSSLHLEINGIEVLNDGTIALRLNDTYIGKSKQKENQQSGAAYVVFPSDQMNTVLELITNHTREGLSTAMFAVSDEGSLENMNVGVGNLNEYFQNQTGDISMVAGTHLAEENLRSYGYVEGKVVGGTGVAGGVCKAVTLFNNAIARSLERAKLAFHYTRHKNHSSGAYHPVITGDVPTSVDQNQWNDAAVAAEAGNAITDLAMSHDGTIHAHGETLYTENLGDGRTASFTVVNADVTQ